MRRAGGVGRRRVRVQKRTKKIICCCSGEVSTMSDTKAVEMDTKTKKPAGKRAKAKASGAPHPKQKTPSKTELLEATPRSSVDSVRYENEDAERGT